MKGIMSKKFRLPALLVIFSPVLAVVWYVLNDDGIGSVLFGEKLYYCHVTACSVTRNRFLPVAGILLALFLIGLALIVIRTWRGGKNA
jgi:hypothetical protein